ncbi:unnamed protein product [Oncorhynchus mykiss]|uniref:Beta/gamma crystallin 'Greek key' domain-containing protein n=1 Tax=Oncorhynchus mykiss TaxID=8022 RepID=A0A060WMN2_ONCMY|nr:unnamed protein product [Oncorhynchus mykiss]
MDLRAKPKRFGTFTFGLKRRKKKSDGDLSQSIVVLHGPEPEVKGQEEELLNLSLWDIGQGGTLNKRVRFAVSQPDLNTQTLVTSYPPPTKSQAQEPPMDSPKTATNQPISQMDNIIPLEVGRATRKVPLAMPEMEWNETSQEEESPDAQCDNPYASTDHTDTASPMDVDSFNPSPPPFPPNPPPPSYPSSPPPCYPLSPATSFPPTSSPPATVYTSNQSDEMSPLPSADPVLPVTALSLSKTEASYVTLSIGQPVVVENITTVTPNTDPSPIALDPNIEATITETDTTDVKTETFPLNPDSLADNTETPILNTVTSALITVNSVTDMDTNSINDTSVSTTDTSRPMPETVTSITSEEISTAIADPGPSLAEMVIPVPSTDKSTPEMLASIANTVNSITNSDNTVPNTDTFSANTEVFGTLYDSLFPQSFTSAQESATSDNDSTEGCLDTNLTIINDETNPHLSLDSPFDSPSPILPESVKQEYETAIDHTEASVTDVPVPTAVSKMDTSHPDTDTTANTNLTVTDTNSQPVFRDLYDSLFPGMFPSPHISGHTASALSTYTSGVVTSGVMMDTRCTPPNIDAPFENKLPPVPQTDTAHPSTDFSLAEPEAFAPLCFEPTLPTTEPMEMDDLEPERPTSDSPLPNTDIAVPDTGSSDTCESLYDVLFPELFPSDQVSTISDPNLDKPVYVTDTDSVPLRPDCNTRPNLVDQSEHLTAALPVDLNTEDTENTDLVLHHSLMNIDNSDHILSDNVTLVSDILSASHPSTKNSSTLETTISIDASVSSTTAETMATETGQEAEVQIMEEENGQIEQNIMSYDVDVVRERSNDMSTTATEKVQEAEVEVMEEANSIDSNRQIKEHMPCDADVNRASSQCVIIPENSNAMEVAIPAVHYSILEHYMEESGVEEVKAEEMKGAGKQRRNGNETVEAGWSLGSQKVTEVLLETKDRGQENEVHREEKRRIESPEDGDAERLVPVEERGTREVSALVKEGWEDGVKPALPVQQVHTLMECESPAPPSITEQHGEEEGSGSNRSAVTHAYLVTEACADTHTLRQTPGHEEPQESHSSENEHAATGNRERQDTLATHNTLAHTTDREGSILDTLTAEEADLVTRTTEDTSSFSEQKAKVNTTSTHGENTFALDREETTTDAESRTYTVKIEHEGTLGTEWIDSIVTQETDRASSEQVAVNPPVARDTTLDRLRKRANGLATERPGAEPEQVGGTLSVTADTLLNSLRNRVQFLSQPEGSLDASAVNSTALEDSEDSDSEIQQIVADLESDSEMKSYSSTLTLRPSPTHKGMDKSKQGFRKVSLVTDNDTTDHTEDSVDYRERPINEPNRTESDLGPVAPEYKWRNLYEGVQTTFEPKGETWRSDSQSDESRVSTYDGHYSSLSPSLSVYTRQLTSLGPPFQEPGLSSLSSETPRSPGNGRWLSDRSEVQLTRESSEPETGTGRGSRRLTKEKEHGKLNPRPGKMFIFDQPGMCGQRTEVWSDVVDATPWQLQETISIRVVRGGWVLYEKPNFKGEKIALDEGDIELTYPFDPPEEEGGEEVVAAKPARRFIIGSVRRVVRDYSVPEISLFPEENAEGKKVTFRDTSDDARIFGFPIKANSIIINAGLWLVYAQPFFQGIPRVLEVGGFPNPAAWGVEQPYVGSVHPLKIGEPRVEKPGEPKLVLYEKPYFTGKTRTIYTNMRDFMTRKDRQQTAFIYSPGSIKVQGGCWVGYEKEGFRGHQYMLEEGEYHDWRVWGGCDAELRSVRVIRADLTEPMLVLYEQHDVEQNNTFEDNTFEVTEAIPDVELFGFRTTTRSIHVVSGAWIAYSHVDFSGDQYILEKGFYSNSADWGSSDNRICSVQPILQASRRFATESEVRHLVVMLYTEPDFEGECHVCDKNQESLSDKLIAKSCRVVGGSWVVYEGCEYSGNLYILSEGDYPNFTSMGCPPNCVIRSLKTIPLVFSVPSISLFGLECLEGREITVDTEVVNMLEEGYNNHLLSVRVNRGCWVMCEHSNYRGRQFLLEPIEITNWPKFSQLLTIGSMYPVRQRRHFFRIKSKERGHFLSIQGGVEEMKSGRVVVTEQVEGMSDIWFYQEGLIKNKLAPTMSLQVMGNVEAGAKVVLWSETRQPVQTWSAQMRGTIPSLTFPGMVLDIKGGKQYDRDHVVILPESEERPCQQWELELL